MKKYTYGGIVVLILVNMVVWPYVVKGNELQVTFFDVGQGDAILTTVTQLTLYSYFV